MHVYILKISKFEVKLDFQIYLTLLETEIGINYSFSESLTER